MQVALGTFNITATNCNNTTTSIDSRDNRSNRTGNLNKAKNERSSRDTTGTSTDFRLHKYYVFWTKVKKEPMSQKWFRMGSPLRDILVSSQQEPVNRCIRQTTLNPLVPFGSPSCLCRAVIASCESCTKHKTEA